MKNLIINNRYFSFFRMRFINGLQYRAAAASGIATQFAWGLMEILLYRAFYLAGGNKFPMEFGAVSSYIWLQQAFLAMFMTWFWETELFELIKTGNIAYELCRPVDIYNMWFVRGMANRLSKAVLRAFPIIIVALFLPEPFKIIPPQSLTLLFLFIISMLLGFLVVVAFGMIIYALTFITVNPQGLKMISQSIAEFLSGAVIPLPFLPDNLRGIVDLLPFASMQNAPFIIYGGSVGAAKAFEMICLQLFWAAALIITGRLIMNRALKNVVIQGG